MNERTIGLSHARVAIGCNACFDASSITRAGISLPQPITVGRRYRKGGIAVVSINPGASMDGGYKQARKRALDRFAAGDDTALLEYWNSLASDATNFWNPNYLARIRRLGLHIDSLVVGNIALCATESNRYPTWMLRNCWTRHTGAILRELAPTTVVLMGAAGLMGQFAAELSQTSSQIRVTRMAHYAHREGAEHERGECLRVKRFIAHCEGTDAA